MLKTTTMNYSNKMYSKIKRFFDIFLAILLLMLLLIPLLLISLLINYKLGSPVFFRQLRPGLHGKPFIMYKFRTMTNETDDCGILLPDSQRLSKFGKFLRSSSIDELPELFNVLKGDMSLVGPRPLLIEYLSLYSDEQSRRNDVLPGITGWAQVNGRNSLSWNDKFQLDVWYVNNRSFFLDIKILFLTFKSVLLREGINSKDHATMPPFKG